MSSVTVQHYDAPESFALAYHTDRKTGSFEHNAYSGTKAEKTQVEEYSRANYTDGDHVVEAFTNWRICRYINLSPGEGITTFLCVLSFINGIADLVYEVFKRSFM